MSMVSDSAKILLIDSNEKERKSVSGLLSGEGYSVYPVDNGSQALKKAGEEVFDLIIVDITLPDIKGADICLRLKKNRRNARAPVVVLSAKDDTDEIEELFQKGISDYIIKPPRISYLISRVEFHITSHRTKR